MGKWSKEEINFLIGNYKTMSYKEIAFALNRSLYSVNNKTEHLGLRISKEELQKRALKGIKEYNKNNDMTGENNPNWKGGITNDNYHYKKLQKERYPKRVKARDLLFREIRKGNRKRGNCAICGEENAQAHHEDYEKPLDVVWLCRKHHRELHDNRDLFIVKYGYNFIN